MSKALRIIGSSLVGIVLAVALAVQSTSAVSTRTDPVLALQLAPDNGRALGKYAFGLFGSAVQDGAKVSDAAKTAEPWALKGYQEDPLNPEALAILAMAQNDVSKKRKILTEAARLNRRSLALQGLALQMHVEQENFPEAVATLDQILRVHPERSAEFFPVLAGALSQEEVIPSFVEILSGEPPWQDSFLRFAAIQPSAVRNAAKLQKQLSSDEPALSKQMIAGLVVAGDFAAAREHYQFAKKVHPAENKQWPSQFPPFDWKFADSRDIRAQVSRDGKEVELFVKSGSGGLMMERLFEARQSGFPITVKFDSRPIFQAENVRLQVTCLEQKTTLLDRPLSEQGAGFEVAAPPPSCEVVKVGIYARSWRGKPALRGSIQSIEIGTN